MWRVCSFEKYRGEKFFEPTLLVEAIRCKATKDCDEEIPFHVETVAQRIKCPFIVVTKAAADSRVSARGLDGSFLLPISTVFCQNLPFSNHFRRSLLLMLLWVSLSLIHRPHKVDRDGTT